jgi:hypothetical protein
VAQKGEMTFQKFKEGVQFFLIIFAASWGIYTFIYKDIIVPAKRPPAVTLAATLEELDRADGMILVRAHLVVANRGDGKVWVPALWWNVYGVSFGGEDRTASQFANDVRPLLQRGDEGVSRFSNIRSVEIVAAGRVPDHELWYQPKDESVHEHLFLVPEGRFDAVQVYVDAYISKSIGEFAPTRWEINKEGVLTSTLLLKQTGWDKDSSRVVPFAPETNRTHRKLIDREDAGHNFTTASLRIKPKASTAKAMEQNSKR